MPVSERQIEWMARKTRSRKVREPRLSAAHSIAFAKSYMPIIDEVRQDASVSRVLTSGRRMVRSTHDAHEKKAPKVSVSGLGATPATGATR